MPSQSQSLRSSFILFAQIAGLICLSGCAFQRTKWREPIYATPVHRQPQECDSLANAEQLYAQAITLRKQECASCVDLFFEVAVLTCQSETCTPEESRNRQLHDSALRQLIISGEKFNRLDPASGLVVYRRGDEQLIPFHYQGFEWKPKNFQQLVPVGDYKTKALSRYHRCPGVGVPLVVTGCPVPEDTFYPRKIVFAATLRLNVNSRIDQANFDPWLANYQLELYDPLRVDTVSVGDIRCPIAKDLSAPIAYRIMNRRSTILSGFINPGNVSPDSGSREGNLYTLEPYQPGKVPIVLIHGLLSDPFTWAEMINELWARPGFVDRFQIWVFEYPTGRPFLGSAVDLREQLALATQTFDPQRADPQLFNMILAGHSMGGLVAKLQITCSGDRLWRAVANRPIDQIAVPNDYRQTLTSAFFFRPSPHVSRVVYFATPHRGSAFATRIVGRIGSSLVTEPAQRQQQHRALIQNNPGVFSDEVRGRIPTSIDLLEPRSPLLQAIEKLPTRCGVATHSVIGDRCFTVGLGRSDGIVPVRSAREPGVISERLVNATHTRTKELPDSIQEMLMILDQHLQQSHQQQVEPISAVAR